LGFFSLRYLFADEAGNFDFSQKGSKYFIVTAISMDNFDAGIALLDLRHRLAHSQAELFHDGFHASEDKQPVRDEVFTLLDSQKFRIDAVVLEKSKAYEHLKKNEHQFYKIAWYLLFKYIAKTCFPDEENGLVIAGSLGTRKKHKDFQQAITDVVSQHSPNRVKAAAWSASSHPCLQIADYCCWAIQRKYEQQDDRSFVLIQKKISTCFLPW
jgi:hypothetical protein